MVSAENRRMAWQQLPGPVRAAVEEILGTPVVAAVSQLGGFSPGTADRVTTAAGGQAFVKAAGATVNPVAVELHRREFRVLAQMPAAAHAPRLLGVHDDDGWFALVVEDVEGRSPRAPWHADEIERVAAGLRDLAAVTVADASLPALEVDLAPDLAGWERIAADRPRGLDAWTQTHLDRLRDEAASAAATLHGEALVHGDLRGDNILLEPDGGVRFVDWPGAARGAAWFDTLCLLVNVQLYGGHDVEALARQHLDVEPGAVDAVLAGLAGYFVDAARLPPPPGLPTVRAFQAAQGESTVRWLRARWERSAQQRARVEGDADPGDRAVLDV